MLDLGVELGEALLLLFEVVKGAVVLLGVAMLSTVHKAALAGHLHEANFLVALPALVLVRLISHSKVRLAIISTGGKLLITHPHVASGK